MKIKKINVKNFKAISEAEVNFDGCSAIVTAGNNRGKTSLLRGLIDRLRGEKPEIILKEGQNKGNYVLQLTDGSKIEWSFTEKSENFAYTTPEGFVIKTGVIKAIGERYFGTKFDIDKFLFSTPKEQVKMLQKLVNIDFDEINGRFAKAYSERTEKNRILSELRAKNLTEPVIVEKPDIDGLRLERIRIREENDKILREYHELNDKHLQEIQAFNLLQTERYNKINDTIKFSNDLQENTRGDLLQFINFDGIKAYIEKMPKPEEKKSLENLPAKPLHDLSVIDAEIDKAYQLLTDYNNYEAERVGYKNWLELCKLAKISAENADKLVKQIEAEKMDMINSANIPDEFSFSEDGVVYNGLPLSNNQTSSSSKYIASLKLGAMVLGDVKTMHFDASFLDRDSLFEVQTWAEKNGLQLLIERPDFDGGEIKYEIL